MIRRWRFNALGVAIYMLMTGWLLVASTAGLAQGIMGNSLDWHPLVGFGLGLLALIGIGFGALYPDGDSDPAKP